MRASADTSKSMRGTLCWVLRELAIQVNRRNESQGSMRPLRMAILEDQVCETIRACSSAARLRIRLLQVKSFRWRFGKD
jgi:hypothetical protein